jgi:hypothetical protein
MENLVQDREERLFNRVVLLEKYIKQQDLEHGRRKEENKWLRKSLDVANTHNSQLCEIFKTLEKGGNGSREFELNNKIAKYKKEINRLNMELEECKGMLKLESA